MFGEEQLAGEGWQEIIHFFSLPGPVSSCQNVQFFCKNEPKCADSLPWQEKCQSNSSAGVVGKKKFDFLPEEFSPDPDMPRLIPRSCALLPQAITDTISSPGLKYVEVFAIRSEVAEPLDFFAPCWIR